MNRRTVMLTAGGLAGGWSASQVLAASPAAAAGSGAVFDVRAYGAAGDGTTDDTQAFQDALSAARAATGGATLLIPPGTYAIAQSLVLGAGLTVHAYGAHVLRTKDCGALLKNFDSATSVTGYGGAGDIAVLGGRWDMRGEPVRPAE